MNLQVARIAQSEFNDAQAYYEIQRPGLGLLFSEEMRRSILRIQKYPFAGSIEKGEIRHYHTHKFPYKILYSVQDKTILIIAFAHQHRLPFYWIDRVI